MGTRELGTVSRGRALSEWKLVMGEVDHCIETFFVNLYHPRVILLDKVFGYLMTWQQLLNVSFSAFTSSVCTAHSTAGWSQIKLRSIEVSV
jgi:hypothetical protein